MAPLCERLELIDEDRNHNSALVDRVVSFDLQERSLNKWLTAFGVEDRNYNLLQCIDGDKSKDGVFRQIERVIADVLNNKQNEKEIMREMFAIKIKQMIEEKQRNQAVDVAISIHDKSIDDVEMNKVDDGASKLSLDAPATGRKSTK